MKIKEFGITALGEKVDSYNIENEVASVTIITFGGIIQ